MKLTVASIALNYQAAFREPFFRVADARLTVLESLYRALAEFGVTPADIVGYGGNSLADQRARIMLFRGNATLDLTAEKVGVNFRNAVRDDIALIKKCLTNVLATLEAGDAALGGERYDMYPAVTLDSEADRVAFLQTLGEPKNRPRFVDDNKATISPCYKIEMEGPSAAWHLEISVSRAWAQPTGVFVASNINFPTAASTLVNERLDLFAKGVAGVLESIGLK